MLNKIKTKELHISNYLEICVACDRPGFSLVAEAKVAAQSICCVFGESGTGKTSLARAVAGLEQDWTGTVSNQGSVWQDSNSKIFLSPHQRRVGFVFQGSELFAHLTVSKNLDFAERCGQGSASQPKRQDLVHAFELGQILNRLPHEISGGERQRAAMAQTLLAAPTMMVMDEPMASMSRSMKESLIPYIKRSLTNFNGPMLYVTHSEMELAALADSVLVLVDGSTKHFASETAFFDYRDSIRGSR